MSSSLLGFSFESGDSPVANEFLRDMQNTFATGFDSAPFIVNIKGQQNVSADDAPFLESRADEFMRGLDETVVDPGRGSFDETFLGDSDMTENKKITTKAAIGYVAAAAAGLLLIGLMRN